MSLTRCIASGSSRACSSASFMPRNCWSSTSRRSRSRELLVRRARLVRAPVVLGELAHGARGVAGQRVELGLAQPRVVGRVGEQRGALLLDGRVEQLADLLERAVEPAGLAASSRRRCRAPAQQVVEAAQAVAARGAAGRAAPRAGSAPSRIRSPTCVERLGDVVRRGERVGPVVPRPVRVPPRITSARHVRAGQRHVRRRRRRCGRAPRPC